MNILLFLLFILVIIKRAFCDIWSGYDPRDVFLGSEKVLKRLASDFDTTQERRCLESFSIFTSELLLDKEWTNRRKNCLLLSESIYMF